MTTRFHITMILGMLLSAGAPAWAQTTAQATPRDAARMGAEASPQYQQEFVRKNFKDLTFRMLEAAKLLEESEPASAAAIRQAVDQAQRALIDENMGKVVDYLSRGLSAMADTTQGSVVNDLKNVLKILEAGGADPEKIQKDIQRWQEFLNEIRQLAMKQDKLSQETQMATQGHPLSQQMLAQLATLKELMARQKELLDQTGQLASPAEAAGKLAELHRQEREIRSAQDALSTQTANDTPGQLLLHEQDQVKLSAQAAALAQAVAAAAGDEKVQAALDKAGAMDKPLESASQSAQDAAAEMAGASGAMQATDAAKALDRQKQADADLQAVDEALTRAMAKLSAGTPSAALAGKQDKLSADTAELAKAVQDTLDKSGLDGATSQPTTQPASQPSALAKASGHMQTAGQHLAAQEKSPATAAQQQALEQLQQQAKKIAELAKQTQDMAAKADLAAQAQQQQELSQQTGDVSKKMDQTPADAQSTPGRQNVSQATGQMQQAAGKLSAKQAQEAQPNQSKAGDELKKAQQELEEATEQARQAAQAQALAKLEAQLSQVLSAQRNLTSATAQLAAQRPVASADKPEPPFERAELLKLAELSDGEGQLAEKIGKVIELINAEGTTAVFPAVLGEVKADLTNVQKLLAGKEAGELTTRVQREIEKNLADLIASLQSEMRRRQNKAAGGAGGGGGGGGKKPPLVAPVAELKMLLALQKQINARTVTLDGQKARLPGPELAEQLKLVSGRQDMLSQVARALAQKIKAAEKEQAQPGSPEEQP